ncbi:alcohol dehydrogenase catalytic domain-containing protein [Halomicroarcula sp. GCM10025324]|uniref:alcohol dehydrogenase catalytic domain-containing protein n=1 Tax=Haloarcula TaxID=2237 RepID=UPI0023E88319|nr:alcohol dehydrogenase catalytic domain-containing protein [Halomicroarcula sp. ZS-22-S1]
MDCLEIQQWGGPLTRSERSIPEPDAASVRVEVEATGVGGTVRNVIDGNLGNDPEGLPRIPGHELVGTVDEVGAGVTHLDVGDRVTAYFHIVCGHCQQCLAGHDSLCTNHAGWISVDTDGGFAEYTCLPAGNALRIPEGIPPTDATVIPDAVATPVHVANQRANVERGDRVAVLGAGGGVGIHMVQVADYFGADVTAVDIATEKLDSCAAVGADIVHDPGPDNDLSALDAGSYDAVIDFTGATDLLEASLDLLGPRGRLVNLTTFPGNDMSLSPRAEVMNELDVVGSRYCSKHELKQAASLVADGDVEPVVSEKTDLDGTAALLDRIVDNEIVGRGAMRPV